MHHFTACRTGITIFLLAAFALLSSAGATCPAPPTPSRWLTVWRVGNEYFRCVLERPVDAARVRAAIAAHTSAGIPLGRVRYGIAENLGHAWHMEHVRLVDITVEIYDGRPSDIDHDIGGWISAVKRYGPWSAIPMQIAPIG